VIGTVCAPTYVELAKVRPVTGDAVVVALVGISNTVVVPTVSLNVVDVIQMLPA
jgi:hypothetical protein